VQALKNPIYVPDVEVFVLRENDNIINIDIYIKKFADLLSQYIVNCSLEDANGNLRNSYFPPLTEKEVFHGRDESV